MTTTSSTTTTSTMINSNPPTPTNNNNNGFEYESAAALKKKKKSHLSRDELSRVCHDGDVTFEQYNGSTYMIAIRSQGDRKSLIGYRCDWNNCGYMNARVERMFGHIRSQHPDAPAVKKLVTTTGGSTNTTSSVVTTTTATTTTNNSCGGSSATCTSNTNANHANMSTSTSARLSLRSSSSLSTASSTSSGSLSPRSPGECSSQTHVGDKLIDLLNNQPTSAIDDDDLQHDNVNDELLNIGLPPIKSIDDHTVLDTGINECETKKSYCENKLDELAQSTERIMEELKTISANFEVAAISSTTATIEDTLELFDDDIESLLMNHGSKSSVDNNGYQQHNSSNNNNNQSDNVYHDQQQQQPQPLPSSTQSPIINESPATFHHHQTNTAAKPMEHQVDYQDSYSHSMNDYSYDTTTNNSNNNLEYQVNNQMHNHQQQQQQQHTQSRQSDPLMYGDNGEWNEHDMDSTMMMDDGSNGSVGSNSGSKRDRKKTGSSKNYIGKQNLFQEFQSDDVAKVRDSENKYIIALQKNMKIVGYRCDWPECEFLTCRKYVMVNHINGKHTNQRPYSCPLCNFNFVKRYFLKAHMHKVHKRRISIDGKDDDDLIGGMKRDHSELMDSSFDDEQYDGIDTMVPDTPSTPIPVTSSKKAKNGIKTNSSSTYAPKGPPFYSNPESGYGPPYNSCPPPLPPPVPNTTPNNSDIYSMEPTTMVPNAYYNGYGTPNGTQPVNGCYYGDDSYGSDLSNHGFKSNQLNNTTSAVFMTPSPSSSIASPLPFTANGPGTPNTKCTSFNPITYEPFESPMYQQAPPSNQPTQQQPFLNRSYSTPSSSSSSSMYSTCNSNTAGPIVKSNSVGSNPMINQTDLLTPPLSNGPNCGGTRSTNDTAASMFPNQSADQSTFTSFTDSTNGYTNNSSSNGNNQGFDDFLSPPSSISSSGSNYSSSYMGAMCPDQQSGNNNTSANVNSSVSANSGANQRQPMQQSANTQYSNSGPTNFANSFNTEASYNGKPSSRSYSNCPPQPPTYGSSSASANSYDQCYYDQNSSSAYGNSMLNVGNGRKSFPTGGYNNGFVNGINNTNQTVNGGNGSMFVDPYNTIDSYGNVPSKPVTGSSRTIELFPHSRLDSPPERTPSLSSCVNRYQIKFNQANDQWFRRQICCVNRYKQQKKQQQQQLVSSNGDQIESNDGSDSNDEKDSNRRRLINHQISSFDESPEEIQFQETSSSEHQF
ncbi:hypothetical protein RDWZM_000453 [Blomia tropicalis]|uniref:C2H2-type domain-containing protein n=1 Tax=Blomia tropicalis TaxID=40697 RepID=A0A9Q0MAY1_BLOTA|nr:hypothetical protein RDWZM_000453 [Blomia tropicalis]